MPRQARVVIPNTPHHILQRGHNRQIIFASDEDYHYYLDNLRELKRELSLHVFSYCLMTNHVHMIIDPGENPENLALLMKRLAGRQTRYVNKLEKRTGSLWDGRFKSSPISTDEYLLLCCRYIDLNPVRAGMVDKPDKYKWSSYRTKIAGINEGLVDKDKIFMALGEDDLERSATYKDYVEGYGGLSDGQEDGGQILNLSPDITETEFIRKALQRGQLTGSVKFNKAIEEKMGIRVSLLGPGRSNK